MNLRERTARYVPRPWTCLLLVYYILHVFLEMRSTVVTLMASRPLKLRSDPCGTRPRCEKKQESLRPHNSGLSCFKL